MSGTATGANEAQELGELAFRELAGLVGGIGSIHRAVADRAFGATGAIGRPTQIVHDAISSGVYAALRGSASLAGPAAGAALGRRAGVRELSVTPRGAAALAVINGLIGDALAAEGSGLSEPMALRVRGAMVEAAPEALAAAYPDASPHLVLFVPGLMETEFSWRTGAAARGGETYASGLVRELGCTPVDVRYNTGLHISANGVALADLIQRIVDAWPVVVERIDLIGHSMGGLVARSACHHASLAGRDWAARVRHTVSLGTPHLGAPLPEVVHLAAGALHLLPESRPFATFLRRRSAGVRDLRRGSLVDEDWKDRDPDALRAAATAEVPLHESAQHWFVTASLTRSASHPVARLMGDALVLERSAAGRSRDRRIAFEADAGLHVGRTHHLALVNHPAVGERLVAWLDSPASEAQPALG